MEQSKILQAIANTIIDKPLHKLKVSVKEPKKIPKRTFLDWLLRKPIQKQEIQREFTINPCVVNNMYRIAGRASVLPTEIMDGTMASMVLPLIISHKDDIVYIVAAGIQNSKREPDEELIEFIGDNFDGDDLFNCLKIVLNNEWMQSFLNSIALAKGTVRILEPKASPLDGRELIASHTQE